MSTENTILRLPQKEKSNIGVIIGVIVVFIIVFVIILGFFVGGGGWYGLGKSDSNDSPVVPDNPDTGTDTSTTGSGTDTSTTGSGTDTSTTGSGTDTSTTGSGTDTSTTGTDTSTTGSGTAAPVIPDNALMYKQIYYIENQYTTDPKKTYLDTRGPNCEENAYCVSTKYGASDRDSKSTLWRLIKHGDLESRGPVTAGDMVFIENQFGNKTYLDTRGAGCEENAYCVSTKLGPGIGPPTDRDLNSTYWKIFDSSNMESTDILTTDDQVNIQNQFGPTSYLGIRGGGCEDNVYCVSTGLDGGGSGYRWKFVKVESVMSSIMNWFS